MGGEGSKFAQEECGGVGGLHHHRHGKGSGALPTRATSTICQAADQLRPGPRGLHARAADSTRVRRCAPYCEVNQTERWRTIK